MIALEGITRRLGVKIECQQRRTSTEYGFRLSQKYNVDENDDGEDNNLADDSRVLILKHIAIKLKESYNYDSTPRKYAWKFIRRYSSLELLLLVDPYDLIMLRGLAISYMRMKVDCKLFLDTVTPEVSCYTKYVYMKCSNFGIVKLLLIFCGCLGSII